MKRLTVFNYVVGFLLGFLFVMAIVGQAWRLENKVQTLQNRNAELKYDLEQARKGCR